MHRPEAYDKAIEFISSNPERNICQILKGKKGRKRYTVTCWKGDFLEKPTFEKCNDDNVFLYSKTFFYGKDNVPGRKG